ncbi:acyltransferase family protein [Pseudonocardia lacus]|uniref:acyltransferase family protein n=1 Tax=Pseudonocardia lacus TaxID=2835865 RepID=UPI001BDCAB81|nr:acyltransferase family protein [Pseudonocardia lacus]
MTRPTGRPPAPPTAPTRLLHVDNLRTVLTVLVVVHHAAIGYSNIPLWYYVEGATDPSGTLLDILLVLNQSFFMGAFFLISALFVPGSYDRKGPGPFLGQRLLRLGVPLLAWLLVLRPLISFDIYARDTDRAADLSYWQYLLSPDPGPMWFVEVLLLFSALYVLWRLMGRSPAAAPTGRAPGAVAVVGFTAALALATYLWRIAVPMGQEVLGLPTPAYLPQYAALFVVGLVAARRGWLEGLSRTAGRVGFAVAGAAAVGLLLVIFTSGGEEFLGNGTLPSLVAAICESALAVGMVIGLLVQFRARWSGQGPTSRFLSTHAYAVYVVHPVVLVAVGYALGGVAAPAVVKFALLTALAVPLCWAVAYVVRSLPGARKVL